MKARLAFLLIAILSLTFSISLSAATLTAEEQARVEELRIHLSVMTGQGPEDWRAQLGLPDDFVIKCGTPLILEARDLQRRAGTSLGFNDFLQRALDDDLPLTYNSQGGHFKIHYTESGPNATTLSYVQTVADVAEHVWDHHINQLGYHEPPADGAYEFGGDDRYDIYLLDLGDGYYGYTDPDTLVIEDGHYRSTSYLALHTHYERLHGYEDNPEAALRVTVAHEFFHAIQFWYDATEHSDETVEQAPYQSTWLEMSSVWMEEETYDEVNDYYFYLPHYMNYIHLPLRYFATSGPQLLYAYGAGLFAIYLVERFDRDIIKTIWENCEPPGATAWYGAIQDAIDEHSNGTRTFEDMFAEYARWLYFAGSRQPYYFEEAANYPETHEDSLYADEYIPYIRSYGTYPTTVRSRDYRFFPYELGINYVDFDVTTLGEGLTVEDFFGSSVGSTEEPPGWRISPMAYNRFQPSLPVWVDDSLYHNHDRIIVQDLEGYTDVVFTIVTTNPYYNRAANAYQFGVLGQVVEIDGNEILPPYPNPFSLSSDNDIRVKVRLTETQPVYLDVFTMAGEKIFSTFATGVRVPVLVWDGHTEHGEEVASGVYLLNVRFGDVSETLKALVIR